MSGDVTERPWDSCLHPETIHQLWFTNTHTRTHTCLISIHTASCSKQRKWFTEPETTRCVDGQSQLSAAPSDNHTHNKSALQTLSGPHNFVCMCDKACPLIVCMQRTDSIIIKHTRKQTRIAQVMRKWGKYLCYTGISIFSNRNLLDKWTRLIKKQNVSIHTDKN